MLEEEAGAGSGEAHQSMFEGGTSQRGAERAGCRRSSGRRKRGLSEIARKAGAHAQASQRTWLHQFCGGVGGGLSLSGL